MARIFLCHASEDKAQVREVYRQLKTLGFTPWLDEVDILPGQDWNYEIELALETSDFVIAFLSARSVEKVGYVQREFRRALYHSEERPEGFIHTIPVKLDGCSVPRQFSRHQWVNLYENGAFDRIVRALHRGLQQRGQPIPEPLTHDPSSARPEPAQPPSQQVPPSTGLSEAPAIPVFISSGRWGGTIERVQNGYGFIQYNWMRPNIFFHASELTNIQFDKLRTGDFLHFQIADGPKGWMAINIQKL